jgi:hypothetical protein
VQYRWASNVTRSRPAPACGSPSGTPTARRRAGR